MLFVRKLWTEHIFFFFFAMLSKTNYAGPHVSILTPPIFVHLRLSVILIYSTNCAMLGDAPYALDMCIFSVNYFPHVCKILFLQLLQI